MRIGVGDTVAVFDGRGHEFLAKVATALRRDVRVQLMSRIEPAAEAAVPLTLVQAVLKGDKMDDVVRDAVMLGIAAVQPVVTKRTETTVAALMRSASDRSVAARRDCLGEAIAPGRGAADSDAADDREPARRTGAVTPADARRAGRRRGCRDAVGSPGAAAARATPRC